MAEKKIVDLPATEKLSEADKATRLEVINKARTNAKSDLAAKYRDEVNASIKAQVNAAGFQWEPALTPEEKAEAAARELIANTPGLAEKLGIVAQPGA